MQLLTSKLKDWRVGLFLVLMVTTLAYSNIFENNFTSDELDFLVRWPEIQSFNYLNILLLGDLPLGHEGVYRPTRSLWYVLALHWLGEDPVNYHMFALAIHLVGTSLVFGLVKDLSKHQFLALTTALLFGLHPMHVEAVTFTTAAFDTLAMVFGMLSVWSFLRAKIAPTEASRWWRWLSYGAAILAVGGNELTLVLPVLVMLVDLKGVSVNLWSEVRKRWKTYIPYWLIVSVYSYIRFIYLGVGARAPYQAYSMYYSVLSSIKAYAKYLEILVWPVKLNYNHMLPGDIAAHTLIEINSEAILKQRFSDTPILFSLMVIGVLVWLAVKLWRNSRFLSLGIAWTLIGLLPGINLYPNASQFQERYAYMASLGFCLAIGFGLAEIYSWLNRKAGTHKATVLMTVVLIGISGYYGYRTYTRNIDWRSEVAIWAKTLEDSPDNAIVVYKLGSAYRDEGKLDKAKKWYLQSLELYPNLVEAMNNLGVIAEKSGELGEARKYYEQALKLRPGMSELYNNLGVIELREKNNNQAVSLFTRAIELNPEYVQAQQNLIKAQAEWE